MESIQKKIKNRLASLEEIDDVTVSWTQGFGAITITHRLHHAADFHFKWVDGNHYVGYFVDGEGNESEAVVSLWSAMDAIKFIVLYSTMVDLKAKREQTT